MNRFENITKPLMWFMALLLTAFVAGCGGGSSESPAPSSAKAINTFSIAWTTGLAPGKAPGTIDQTFKTIKVTVPHATLLTPMTATFTATGVVTVGSVPQVSGSPTQSQSDFTLPVSYKVTAADGTWATYTVLVTHDPTVTSLVVNPSTASIPAGGTQLFQAIATWLDSSTTDMATSASWTSGAANATVGLHTGLAAGVTTNTIPVVITVDFGGKTATAALTVTPATLTSMTVTPGTASVAAGSAQQFTATGTYSDLNIFNVTTTATWTADLSGNATVDSVGRATGVNPTITPVVITASLSGQSATAQLDVTPATLVSIAVTPASAVVSVGGTQQFMATGMYTNGPLDVTLASVWTSGASGVASVVASGATAGLATGLATSATPVVITATLSGQTSTAALTVSPAAVDLKSILTNNFVILATSAITEATPANGAITGNIGLSPATGAGIAVTCAEMLNGGQIHEANAGITTPCAVQTSTLVGPAVLDMGKAYTAASDPATPAATDSAHLNVLGGILPAGTNFPPGTYTWNTPGDVNINGDITLTGGANDVWIFQISGNLTTAPKGSVSLGTKIVLVGTAAGTPKASNVFWQVAGGSTTLGTYSTFNGNILTAPAGLIAIQTGAVLHGRALSGTSVALDGNIVGP